MRRGKIIGEETWLQLLVTMLTTTLDIHTQPESERHSFFWNYLTIEV